MSRMMTVKVGNDYFTTGACGLNTWTNVLKNRLVERLGRYEELGEPEELVKVVRCKNCVDYGECEFYNGITYPEAYCANGCEKKADNV